MEFQILAHGAYLVFYGLCREAFPGISDQTVATMVAGIDTLILRPDDELRRLARLALELGVGDAVKEAVTARRSFARALAGSEAGERWLADLEQTKDPWFCFSYGNGLYHHHRSWIDDTTLPLATIGSYVGRLEAGEDISRPQAAIAAERERITDEYRTLLPADLQQAFDEQLALCRTVFPHVESHGFYVDHWYHTLFWNKVREFGALLARHGFLADAEDVFFLQHGEVRTALEELRVDWSTGGAGQARGPHYWPPIVERRKAIYEAMREWAPPPALGEVPETITDPVTIMLFGITTERVQEWLGSDGADEHVLTGFAGSPGVAEGTARVVLSPDRLGELEEGEILIAPFTSPSWAPVFGTIAGAVLDAGGIMSHAAIVAREYGLPAVVGTGHGDEADQDRRSGSRRRLDRRRHDPRRCGRRVVSYVFPLNGCGPHLAEVVGGKAVGLGSLLREELQVPPGFALGTHAYREFVSETGLDREIHELLEGAESIEAQAEASGADRRALRGTGARRRRCVRSWRARTGSWATTYRSPCARARFRRTRPRPRSPASTRPISGCRARTPSPARSLRCWASLFTPQALSYFRRVGPARRRDGDGGRRAGDGRCRGGGCDDHASTPSPATARRSRSRARSASARPSSPAR